MTDTFEDLKIAPALAGGVEAVGWDAPTGLQRDAMAVIRRGNNVVLHASAGAGVVGAYGLGVLDRLATSEGELGQPAALVLVADGPTASATADSLARLAAPAELTVRALGPGWATGPAHVLVASAGAALAAVRSSDLKLDGLAALVVDGADLLADTGQWSDLETLMDIVPGGAQRVLATGRFDNAIQGLTERHVRKAMTVPPRSEASEARGSGGDAVVVRYMVVPEGAKAAAAVGLLPGMSADQVAVVCRSRERADHVARALRTRGVVRAADTDGPQVLVLPRVEADQRSIQADVLSYDVPFDADEMAALHGGGAVLVTPRERAHLLRIAARAGIELEAVAAPAHDRTPADDLRDRIRSLADGDLAAELALLEPLLAELPAAEVAAAAVRLARGGAGSAASPATAGGSTPGRAGAPPPGTGTWVHLFMDIGSRDDVGPGDIVGAITGEAGVSGDQVGRIDIRESHTTVEVATAVAARVIEALNGRTLRGRSLRVDYDRKDREPRKTARQPRQRRSRG